MTILTKAQKVTNFLSDNPEFRGCIYGRHHDGNLRSRINDGWYECEDFIIEFDDLEVALEKIKSQK